jgi:hypothetical protein
MGKTDGSYRVVFSIDVDSLHGGLGPVWLLAARFDQGSFL